MSCCRLASSPERRVRASDARARVATVRGARRRGGRAARRRASIGSPIARRQRGSTRTIGCAPSERAWAQLAFDGGSSAARRRGVADLARRRRHRRARHASRASCRPGLRLRTPAARSRERAARGTSCSDEAARLLIALGRSRSRWRSPSRSRARRRAAPTAAQRSACRSTTAATPRSTCSAARSRCKRGRSRRRASAPARACASRRARRCKQSRCAAPATLVARRRRAPAHARRGARSWAPVAGAAGYDVVVAADARASRTLVGTSGRDAEPRRASSCRRAPTTGACSRSTRGRARRASRRRARKLIVDVTPPKLKAGKPRMALKLARRDWRCSSWPAGAGAARRDAAGAGAARAGRAAHLGQAAAPGRGRGAARARRRRARRSARRRAPPAPTPRARRRRRDERRAARAAALSPREAPGAHRASPCSTAREKVPGGQAYDRALVRRRRSARRTSDRARALVGGGAACARQRLLSVARAAARCWSRCVTPLPAAERAAIWRPR